MSLPQISDEKMHGITNILFIIFSGVGALLVAIPLPKAIASGNAGTFMVIIWTELACLVQFVNAIRWNGNVENWAPIWCDFCSYFLIATDLALVASGVSINRRLYMIATLDPRRHKRALNAVVDVVLCLVLPCATIPLQYVVQQYRFYIFEDIGCLPGVGNVNLAYPLVWMLPLIVGVVSAGYACLIMRASLQRNHGRMGEAVMSSVWSRRLMAIGAISAIYGLIPTSIAIALLATAYPVTPWPGWRAVHSTTDVIAYVPALEWRSSSIRIASAELRRWTVITLAYVVFMLLGLTADVKKMYWPPRRGTNDSAGSKTVIVSKENTDGNMNDQKAPLPSRFHFPPSGKRRTASHGSFGFTSGSRFDPDLEGFQMVFPVSRSEVDVKEPTDESWALHEGDEYLDSN